MSITKKTAIDEITVVENGIVLYREATSIMEDGNEIAKTFHRSSLTPASDLTGVPNKVAEICNIVWTQDVIDAYQSMIAINA